MSVKCQMSDVLGSEHVNKYMSFRLYVRFYVRLILNVVFFYVDTIFKKSCMII